MIAVQLCIIIALLACLGLSVLEQRRAFRRGYELGRRRGFNEGQEVARE